jgi:hypothetical protein
MYDLREKRRYWKFNQDALRKRRMYWKLKEETLWEK